LDVYLLRHMFTPKSKTYLMNTRIFMGLLITLSLFFTSCAEDSDDRNLDGMGRLTVRLTDAPFPYEEVDQANVTIFKVEIRKASNEESEGEDEGSPFITLMQDDVRVNLLTLINGTTEELADLDIPAGTYDLVRVYVKDANVVLKNGETYDLKVPSGAQTGIKVFVKPGITVSGGLSSDLLLDFDVSKSFVARGNIDRESFNGFIFKPVIIASNTSTSGSLKGTVSTLIQDMETGEAMETGVEEVSISVIEMEGEEEVVYKIGVTDPDGSYLIEGILAGSYKAVAEKEGFVSSDTVAVQIDVANITVQDFFIEEEEETTDDTTDGN